MKPKIYKAFGRWVLKCTHIHESPIKVGMHRMHTSDYVRFYDTWADALTEATRHQEHRPQGTVQWVS